MTNSKKWYESKTIIGGIISLISMIAMIAELDIDEGMITEIVQASFAVMGSILTVIGRLRATKQIN